MFSKLSNFSGPISSFSQNSAAKLLLSLDSYFYNTSLYSTIFTFDDANSSGVTHSSNSATCIGNGGWATYIRSVESYSGKIKLKFKKGINHSMCGFSDMSDVGTYTNINYGFYFQPDYVTIVENKSSGVPGNPAIWEIYQIPGPYLPSSFYSVIYDGTSVKYYIDDVLVYTSIYSPLPTNPLYLYMTFLETGASLTNIEFGSNTIWNDLSGNNRNFYLINSPNYVNSSFYFNADGQYATGSDLGTLKNFTVDTWFNLKTLPSYDKNPQIVTNIFYASIPHINFAIGPINGNPKGTTWDGEIMGGFFVDGESLWVTTDGFTPSTDTWYNTTLTYDEKHLNLYLNGNLYSSVTSSLPARTSGVGIRVAERWDIPSSGIPEFIDGDIDIVRIWNGAITPTQILSNYNSISPRYLTTDSSFVLNGTTNWMEVPKSNDWNLNNTYTIEFWSKAATSSTGKIFTILCQNTDTDNSIDIFYQNGNLLIGNSNILCVEPTPGIWAHIAIVSNSGSMSVFYNGAATYSRYTTSLTDYTHGLAIGRRGVNNDFQYFNGKLYGLRINNTAVYTSNFDPYDVALPPTNISGTVLLVNNYQPYINTFIDSTRGHNIINHGATYSSDKPIRAWRYFKLVITKIKDINAPGGSGCCQMSNFIIRLNGSNISWNNSAIASNPNGYTGGGEGPENLLDNNVNTKWCDQNFLSNNQTSYIYIDNAEPVKFDSYYYTTANDSPERDPITWNLYVSKDNSNWNLIDSRSNETITDTPQVPTQIFSIM
jgi:hypothetical protein